jgi:hypothetical protein
LVTTVDAGRSVVDSSEVVGARAGVAFAATGGAPPGAVPPLLGLVPLPWLVPLPPPEPLPPTTVPPVGASWQVHAAGQSESTAHVVALGWQ